MLFVFFNIQDEKNCLKSLHTWFVHLFCSSSVPDTGWPPILSFGMAFPTCHMTSSPCTSAITIASGSKVTRTIKATLYKPSTHLWRKSSCWSSITLHYSPSYCLWHWWEREKQRGQIYRMNDMTANNMMGESNGPSQITTSTYSQDQMVGNVKRGMQCFCV